MMDELQRQDSLLDIAKERESRLLVEKQKVEEDLKRVTTNLAEERVTCAWDCQEKERLISHAFKTPKELERKAMMEAEKRTHLHLDLDTERSRRAESESAINQALVETSKLTTQLGMLKEDKTWWSSHGVVSYLQYLRRSPHFSGLLDDMATATYETELHDGVHAAYLDCDHHELITEEFRATNASTSICMAETLFVVANDPLPEFQQIQDPVETPDLEVIHQLHDSPSPHVDSN
ncbi:hypothetical protein Hanom_Chr01g00040381 [Helianthus anomalus]